MPRTYVCATCSAAFTSDNPNPKYCSKYCKDINPARRQWLSEAYRQIPDQPCVICGAIFRPKQRGIECCSAECAHKKARKLPDWTITHCQICDKELTARQKTCRNKFCSRRCNAEANRRWHEVPENKRFMREHGARTYQLLQHAPTKIEQAMQQALDIQGIEYTYQYRIENRHGLVWICDFAIPEHRLIIECDGDFWHSLPKSIQRDNHKDAYLRASGWTVLRFSETQIKQDVDACVHMILKYLNHEPLQNTMFGIAKLFKKR